jgi:CMP-N-acetylneuraminic acid synthetase
LQPTTPFRTYQNIDEALTLFTDCKADSVVSVIPAPHHFHPNWQLTITPTQSLSLWNGKPLNEITSRRQQLSSTYVRNGALYIASHSALLKYRSLYGQHCVAYVMPSEGHVNLDTDEDWMLAEQILRQSS